MESVRLVCNLSCWMTNSEFNICITLAEIYFCLAVFNTYSRMRPGCYDSTYNYSSLKTNNPIVTSTYTYPQPTLLTCGVFCVFAQKTRPLTILLFCIRPYVSCSVSCSVSGGMIGFITILIILVNYNYCTHPWLWPLPGQ